MSFVVFFVNLLGLAACGWMLFSLLTAAAIFAVVLGGLACAFLLISGITLVNSVSFVQGGQLNLTFARQTRRMLLIALIATLFPTVPTTLLLAATASSLGSVPPAALVCLALLWVPFVVSLVNMIIGGKLLNPANLTLADSGLAARHLE